MNHSQVTHVWANQSKAKAKGFNVFFEGPTIYSHGRHFPIATHVKNSQGQPAVIFTRRDYSVSTSHHKSLVMNALDYGRSIPIFYGEPGNAATKPELRKSFAVYIADAKKLAIKAKRARTRAAIYAEQASDLLDKASKFNAFFKLGMKVPAFEALLSDEEFQRMKKASADATRRERLAQEKREADARKADAECFEAWKNGSGRYCPWSYATDANGSTYLRIKDGEVQTSRGAEVPLDHAKRVFRFVKACKEQGQEWHRNGSQVRIGHFNLDKVTPEGNITAGCHFITWERIAECAQAGGFFEESASSEAVENTAAQGLTGDTAAAIL